MKKYGLILVSLLVLELGWSQPKTDFIRTDSGKVEIQIEPDTAEIVKDTIVDGEEVLEEGDGTYWKKGRPNFIFIIVPLLIVAAPIIILRYRKNKPE